MYTKFNRKTVFVLLFLCFFNINVFAQSHISSQAHDDSVTMISALETFAISDDTFFSAGKDGFLIKWNSDNSGEHYQITDLQIKMIARNPANKEIAVYETDGVSIHRVSVWNWGTFTKKYAKRFTDSVTALSYSEKGTYLLIGTAAMNGVYVLNASSGTVAKKPSNAPSLCSLLKTGDSEKNLIMYSQTGSLVYYSLQAGKQKAKFSAEPRLEQVCLFGSGDTKNRFIAGYKENSVFILDALSGKNIAVYAANSPIIFSSRSEYEDGVYFTSNDGKEYSLKKVSNEFLKTQVTAPSDKVYNPQPALLIKKFTGPKGKDYFTSGTKNISTICLGTSSGSIYTMNASPESEKQTLFPITEKLYEKIYDICTDTDNFYCLTSKGIYKTSYETNASDKVGVNTMNTNIIKYGDGAILWTKNSRSGVKFTKLYSGNTENPEILFTPDNIIQSLRLYNNKLIYLEGNSKVSIFDLESKETREIYTGTAVQDAILYDDTYAYIAKTAAIEPLTALVQVNIETGETVPIKFTGTIAYSLCYDETRQNSPFYGITITTENSKTYTKVFSYSPKNNSTTSLFKLQDEDPDAYTLLKYPALFTNIGKTTVRYYDISSKKTTQFKRSASMPLKADSTSNMVAIVNRDGSISWYKMNSSTVLADWYLTTDGNWISY